MEKINLESGGLGCWRWRHQVLGGIENLMLMIEKLLYNNMLTTQVTHQHDMLPREINWWRKVATDKCQGMESEEHKNTYVTLNLKTKN